MYVQALVAHRSVERLDVPVVGRFAGPAEVDPDLVPIRPEVEYPPRELAAVVHEQELRLGSGLQDPVERSHDVFTLQALTDFNGQRLAGEDIDHRQRPQLRTIGELVSHEVHRPRIVRRAWCSALVALHDHLAPLGQFRAQLQPFLGVEPIRLASTMPPALAT